MHTRFQKQTRDLVSPSRFFEQKQQKNINSKTKTPTIKYGIIATIHSGFLDEKTAAAQG